jgi:hypothetical protein
VAEVVETLQKDEEVKDLAELREKISEAIDVDSNSTVKTTTESSTESSLLKHLVKLTVDIVPKAKTAAEKTDVEPKVISFFFFCNFFIFINFLFI